MRGEPRVGRLLVHVSPCNRNQRLCLGPCFCTLYWWQRYSVHRTNSPFGISTTNLSSPFFGVTLNAKNSFTRISHSLRGEIRGQASAIGVLGSGGGGGSMPKCFLSQLVPFHRHHDWTC